MQAADRAVIDELAKGIAASWPPLSEEQRSQIAAVFARPARAVAVKRPRVIWPKAA